MDSEQVKEVSFGKQQNNNISTGAYVLVYEREKKFDEEKQPLNLSRLNPTQNGSQEELEQLIKIEQQAFNLKVLSD